MGEHTKVITDDGRAVEPGSGETGRVAVGGWQPVGYYKDEAKTAATFITFEGERYSVPGDYATVEADGTLTLLGRGSVCINTGGEKVYPEEVEEVLKTHRGRRTTPSSSASPTRSSARRSPRWWSSCRAASSTRPRVIGHVKGKLAAYKAPKRVLADRHDRAGPERQGRLQAAEGLGRRPAGRGALIARP